MQNQSKFLLGAFFLLYLAFWAQRINIRSLHAQAAAMTQVEPAWPSNEQLTLPIKDIHKVILYFQDGKFGEYLIPKDELEHFLAASIRLHHDPGINPHNQAKTAPLKSISVAYPTLEGPFWWTTPSLQLQMNEPGARIISWTFYKIWTPEKSWIDESGPVQKKAI